MKKNKLKILDILNMFQCRKNVLKTHFVSAKFPETYISYLQKHKAYWKAKSLCAANTEGGED
jgi:hypothetical protein